MSRQLVALEDDEQAALFEWADRMLHRYPTLGWMFAIPNGGKRSIKTAQRLKQTGVKTGVLDVFLPCPVRGYHGLFIEMKRRKGGKITPNQRAFADDMKRQGYLCKFCMGWDEARTEIEAYLNGVYERTPSWEELPRAYEVAREVR
jgi:hypothetical protein